MVIKLVSWKKMSLLTSLIIPVVINFEFNIASTLTSNVCKDSWYKRFSYSGSSNLSLPDSTSCGLLLGTVDSYNPIRSMHLLVLLCSIVVYVLDGFLQFFHCPDEVTSIVRPHFPNSASTTFNACKKICI